MKITKFLVLAILALLLPSCHDDPEPTQKDLSLQGWEKYLGKHFTSETSDQFYLTQHFWDSYNDDDSSHTLFLRECKNDSYYLIRYLEEKEFVEFVDLKDSQITMRIGNDNVSYYNLVNISGKQINVNVKCPNTLSWINKVIEIPLKFDYKANPSYCFLDGKCTDQYGFIYRSCGYIRSGYTVNDQFRTKLHIAFRREDPTSPFPQLREIRYVELGSSNYPEITIKDLSPIAYSFNKTTLRCIQSPVSIQWHSTAWKGEVASLMPRLSDFLQLLIDLPVLTSKEYYFNGIKESEISIERVIRTAFPGVIKKGINNNYHTKPLGDYVIMYEEYGPMNSALSISKIDDNRMCIVVDARDISLKNSKIKDRLFYANILRSLLSEENCHFEMNYKIINTLISDHSQEREFQMTLTEPQHSRNIMEYVILPLLIENRQAIKDYICQDTELSQHADVLCSAVDRLEEIYAGTTDLTLGYRLIEHQWD